MRRLGRGRIGTAAGKGIFAGSPAPAGGALPGATGLFFAAIGSPLAALPADLFACVRAFRPESNDRR